MDCSDPAVSWSSPRERSTTTPGRQVRGMLFMSCLLGVSQDINQAVAGPLTGKSGDKGMSSPSPAIV